MSISDWVFQPWRKCLGVDYFDSCLNIKQEFSYFIIVVLGTQGPWSLYTGIRNLLRATNFQYGHCTYVDFNTVPLLYGLI